MSLTFESAGGLARHQPTQFRAPETELHLELAVALYRVGSRLVDWSAGIAGLRAQKFADRLPQRRVAMPGARTDLKPDLAYALGRGFLPAAAWCASVKVKLRRS